MINRKTKNIVSYKEIITSRGDTFDSLALQMYADETKAIEIIEFNPQYANVLVFDSGITLRLPILPNQDNAETLPPWYDEKEDYTIYEE